MIATLSVQGGRINPQFGSVNAVQCAPLIALGPTTPTVIEPRFGTTFYLNGSDAEAKDLQGE